MTKLQNIPAAEIAAARKRGALAMAIEPRAADAWYDAEHDVVSVRLNNERVVSVPRADVQELTDANPDQLRDVEILGPGAAVHFPGARAGFSVASLVRGEYGSSRWMAQILGRSGGQVSSKAKAVAARKNGRKGGRPRTAPVGAGVDRSQPK